MVPFQTKVDALELRTSTLSAAEHRPLEMVDTSGRTTVAEASAPTRERRKTIRKRLAGLVAKRFLALEGKGRAAGYRRA
jgi:hypothetical protein